MDTGKYDFFSRFFLNVAKAAFLFRSFFQFFVWIAVFAELGQIFVIFSKNQKLSQLLGLSLIAIYKSLTAGFDSVNGFDPNNEVIPSCAPEELSNKVGKI